jgi:hypothetical protein
MTAVRRALIRPFSRLSVVTVVLTVGILGWALIHHRASHDLFIGLSVVLSALLVLRVIVRAVRRTPGPARRWWVRPLLASALMFAATLVFAWMVA